MLGCDFILADAKTTYANFIGPSSYRKDTEPLYHSFMYSLVSLLSGIYPLPAMQSLLVTYQLLTIYQGVHTTYFTLSVFQNRPKKVRKISLKKI